MSNRIIYHKRGVKPNETPKNNPDGTVLTPRSVHRPRPNEFLLRPYSSNQIQCNYDKRQEIKGKKDQSVSHSKSNIKQDSNCANQVNSTKAYETSVGTNSSASQTEVRGEQLAYEANAKDESKHKSQKNLQNEKTVMHSVDVKWIGWLFNFYPAVNEKCINNRQVCALLFVGFIFFFFFYIFFKCVNCLFALYLEREREYHRKGKDLPNLISKVACMKHLLCYQTCCKRFMCAYFLNLKQLSTTDKVLTELMKNTNTLIPLLYHSNSMHSNTTHDKKDSKKIKILGNADEDNDKQYYNSAAVFRTSCTSCVSCKSGMGTPKQLGEVADHIWTSTEAEGGHEQKMSNLSKLVEKYHFQKMEAACDHVQDQSILQVSKEKDSVEYNSNSNDNNKTKNGEDGSIHTTSEDLKDSFIETIQSTNSDKEPHPHAHPHAQPLQQQQMDDCSLMPEVRTQSCPDLQGEYFSLDGDGSSFVSPSTLREASVNNSDMKLSLPLEPNDDDDDDDDNNYDGREQEQEQEQAQAQEQAQDQEQGQGQREEDAVSNTEHDYQRNETKAAEHNNKDISQIHHDGAQKDDTLSASQLACNINAEHSQSQETFDPYRAIKHHIGF
ncbi:hypothetical protein RFI_14584 [Reticulomyxa filosa]|uniref:Uncharacterized protein n=1 Tax=Reticulomyxa filosa TaxID=46433 RepID=X6N9K9_RETFI|nr:hypothetical protein RFI_14584 [Reticulomyxa filosa]|eukprot:ETO22608.1 hypothetical protein RFI_14584 [Reticulomyxa filosa]